MHTANLSVHKKLQQLCALATNNNKNTKSYTLTNSHSLMFFVQQKQNTFKLTTAAAILKLSFALFSKTNLINSKKKELN